MTNNADVELDVQPAEEQASAPTFPTSLHLTDALEGVLAFLARHHFVLLLLTAAFTTRVLWAAVIPLWQAPDEPAHFAYVQSLGEKLSLTPNDYMSQDTAALRSITQVGAIPFHPETTQPFAVGSYYGPNENALHEIPHSLRTQPNNGEKNPAAVYPPGYYLLASLVYRVTADQDTLTIAFSLRMFSALLSTGTILLTYLILRRFFPAPAVSRATVLIITLSPMYTYMGMAINPEVLVWLLFAALLYLMTRALDEGLSPFANLLIAAVLAAGLWTKQTFILALPIYAAFLGFLYLQRSISLGKAIQYGIVTGLALCLLVGWLYAGGFIRTSPDFPGGQAQGRSISGFIRHFKDYWPFYYWTYDSFWGIYGWLDTPISQRAFELIRWGSAATAAVLGVRLLAQTVLRRVDVKALFFLTASLIFIAGFIVLNYLRITTGEIWTLQGRYFFPIIGPIIALMVLGALTVVPSRRLQAIGLLAVVVAITVFQADSLVRFVIPRYYL